MNGNARIKDVGLLVFLLLLAGCAHSIPLRGGLDQTPIVAQVPLTIGIYYPAEFKSYEYAGSRGGDKWIFPLGPASMRLMDKAFPTLFASTVPVQSRPPLPGTNFSAVIEPRIEGFNFELPMLKNGTYSAEITYRFTLYSPKGDPVASWIVTGSGAKQGQFGFEFDRWPGEAADLAMQDAARKLIINFGEVPEVRRWLRQSKEM